MYIYVAHYCIALVTQVQLLRTGIELELCPTRHVLGVLSGGHCVFLESIVVEGTTCLKPRRNKSMYTTDVTILTLLYGDVGLTVPIVAAEI